MTTDTPDACPHCGEEKNAHSIIYWQCHSQKNQRSVLCIEREARQKAEADVERLRGQLQQAVEIAEADVERLRAALQSCWWATNTYDGDYTRACDNVATIAINALKTQDK
jgi:hypothetical protein